MYRKYLLKGKGVLSRRLVASGLAAVFSAGMFGSYAGAMKEDLINNMTIKAISILMNTLIITLK